MDKELIKARVVGMPGIERLNEMQRAMMEDRSRRVMLTAPTGSGKTVAFAVRMLREVEAGRKGVQAVVIAPTRELVVQIAGVLRKIGGTEARCVALYGGHAMREEVNELRVAPAVVVATPGRLVDHINRGNIDLTGARVLVIDEFDKCLQLGFQGEMERIVRKLRHRRLTVLTSATRGGELPEFIGPAQGWTIHNSEFIIHNSEEDGAIHNSEFIIHNSAAGDGTSRTCGTGGTGGTGGMPVESLVAGASSPAQLCSCAAVENSGQIAVGCAGGDAPATITADAPTAVVRPRIDVVVVRSVGRDKLRCLLELLLRVRPEKCIVFVNHRESAERVYEFLRREGVDAVLYHGGLDQQQRKMAVELLANGSRRVMVATDLAARGLDLPDVDAVVHYHLPGDAETWTHRNGRAGRQGGAATAYAIVGEGDGAIHNSEFIIHNSGAGEDAHDTTVDAPATLRAEWATLYINAGKKEKISKGDVAGYVMQKGGLDREQVGRIAVDDHYSLVAVPASLADDVVAALRPHKIKGVRVKVSVVGNS